MGGFQVNNALLGITRAHGPDAQSGSLKEIELKEKSATSEGKTKNIFSQLADKQKELRGALFQPKAKANTPQDVQAISTKTSAKGITNAVSNCIQKVHTFIEGFFRKEEKRPQPKPEFHLYFEDDDKFNQEVSKGQKISSKWTVDHQQRNKDSIPGSIAQILAASEDD